MSISAKPAVGNSTSRPVKARTISLQSGWWHTAITVSQAPVRLPQVGMHPMYPGHWLPFGDGVFWSGLLVLALAEVFRQGLALKREHDLTV